MALKSTARRRARAIALQALYAWKLAGGDALAHARTLEGWERCDQKLAEELVAEVTKKSDFLEKSIAPWSGTPRCQPVSSQAQTPATKRNAIIASSVSGS